MNYKGFVPHKGWSPEIVPPTISPEDFFMKYVATRTPVIFSGFFLGIESDWSLSNLDTKAGQHTVDVEIRDKSGNFGKGNKVCTSRNKTHKTGSNEVP